MAQLAAPTQPRHRQHPALGIVAERLQFVLHLSGDYDLTTATGLTDTISGAIFAQRNADLVLDMHRVTFIDAATIHVILDARTILAKLSRTLTVRSPSRAVLQVLTLCELQHLIDPTAPTPAIPRPA